MRERLALGVLILTMLVILGLSGLFAARHPERDRSPENRDAPRGPSAEASTFAANRAVEVDRKARVARGRVVFAEQRCAGCHSIAGEGNPRAALDGVGARLQPNELRQWITGAGSAADILTPAVQRRKQPYQSLPERDLEALVAYLESLKVAPE